jgi:hypothetical protein
MSLCIGIAKIGNCVRVPENLKECNENLILEEIREG